MEVDTFISPVEVRRFESLQSCWRCLHHSPHRFRGDLVATLQAVFDIQGPLTGAFQTWGFPDLDSSVPICPFLSFLSFLELSRFFPGFSRCVRGFSRFPLSRPIDSTYEEQSRKGPRHNLDLSTKKWETRGLASPKI